MVNSFCRKQVNINLTSVCRKQILLFNFLMRIRCQTSWLQTGTKPTVFFQLFLNTSYLSQMLFNRNILF